MGVEAPAAWGVQDFTGHLWTRDTVPAERIPFNYFSIQYYRKAIYQTFWLQVYHNMKDCEMGQATMPLSFVTDGYAQLHLL